MLWSLGWFHYTDNVENVDLTSQCGLSGFGVYVWESVFCGEWVCVSRSEWGLGRTCSMRGNIFQQITQVVCLK